MKNSKETLKNFKLFCLSYQLDENLIDLDINKFKNYKNSLENDGFVIIKNLIQPEIIDKIVSIWSKNINLNHQLNTGLALGQKNYTKNFFGKYIRHFDFYWNTPTCMLTRKVSLILHAYRNCMMDLDPFYGLSYRPDKTGIYLAVTLYPAGCGFMAKHTDPNSFLPIHYNLPLTFKGSDYDEGGLIIYSPKGKIDIESMVGKGDLILFKGSLPHEISPVRVSKNKNMIGRMQMFAIPTQFTQSKKNSFLKEMAFEVYGRYKYATYQIFNNSSENNSNFR